MTDGYISKEEILGYIERVFCNDCMLYEEHCGLCRVLKIINYIKANGFAEDDLK